MHYSVKLKLTSCAVFILSSDKEDNGSFSLLLTGDVQFTVGSSLTSSAEEGLLIISMPKHFSLNSEVFNITAKCSII